MISVELGVWSLYTLGMNLQKCHIVKLEIQVCDAFDYIERAYHIDTILGFSLDYLNLALITFMLKR